MNIDTLRHSAEIIRDTVYIKSSNELVGAYEKLIDSQHSTYNFIIFVFLGIVGLFAGFTWFYQRRGFKKEIENKIIELINVDLDSFLRNQKIEFNKELNLQKAESARLFAYINEKNLETSKDKTERLNSLVNLVFWWKDVMVYNKLANNPIGERNGVNGMISSLEKVVKLRLEVSFYKQYNNIYMFNFLIEPLKYINETLTYEKNILFELLNKIALKNHIELDKEKVFTIEKSTEIK